MAAALGDEARVIAEPMADVVILRWPEEESSLQRLRDLGRPRLLIVGPETAAPPVAECDEDWIRLPADDADVRVRITALAARAARHALPPRAKGDGRLTYRGRWVGLTGAEERLAELLCRHFGEVVDHEAIAAAARPAGAPGQPDRPASPNGLRVNISRLRKRIAPLGLVVRRIHNRGYVLEAA
ncbi:MAG TPA: helix-turn-helix domain-containing protein [Actinomycetota bacterium]|nr:helix-turn-helix domain-containing protein [Actinomycetota bacterium]